MFVKILIPLFHELTTKQSLLANFCSNEVKFQSSSNSSQGPKLTYCKSKKYTLATYLLHRKLYDCWYIFIRTLELLKFSLKILRYWSFLTIFYNICCKSAQIDRLSVSQWKKLLRGFCTPNIGFQLPWNLGWQLGYKMLGGRNYEKLYCRVARPVPGVKKYALTCELRKWRLSLFGGYYF